MNSVQLFNFNSSELRVMLDKKNNPWFVAKDICDTLTIKWNGSKSLDSIKKEWQLVVKLPTSNGVRSTILISEPAVYKLAFRSNKAEAEIFTDWVASEVLPTIRKTGSYTLSRFIQPKPRTWSKTYPDLYFQQVLKLYNMSYEPGTNPPQFVGKFTNEYVYNSLDSKLGKELKRVRLDTSDITEQRAYMHQFLNCEGKDILLKHLDRVCDIMCLSNNIDHFRRLWSKLIVHRNQLELYLK